MTSDEGDAAPPTARPLRERPPRPTMSTQIPSPLAHLQTPPPPAMVTSVWMWITSSVIGGVSLAYAVARLDTRRQQLRALASAADPTLTAQRLDAVVKLLIVASLVAIAVPMMLQLLLALVMRSGRSWARIVLVILPVVTIPALIIAGPTLAVDDAGVSYVLIGCGLVLLLLLGAVVSMFLPSSGAWLRLRRNR